MRTSGSIAVTTVEAYISAIKYKWRINNGGVAPPLHHGGISILLADARARSTRIVKKRRGLTVHFLRALVAADAPTWIFAPIGTAYHFSHAQVKSAKRRARPRSNGRSTSRAASQSP